MSILLTPGFSFFHDGRDPGSSVYGDSGPGLGKGARVQFKETGYSGLPPTSESRLKSFDFFWLGEDDLYYPKGFYLPLSSNPTPTPTTSSHTVQTTNYKVGEKTQENVNHLMVIIPFYLDNLLMDSLESTMVFRLLQYCRPGSSLVSTHFGQLRRLFTTISPAKTVTSYL